MMINQYIFNENLLFNIKHNDIQNDIFVCTLILNNVTPNPINYIIEFIPKNMCEITWCDNLKIHKNKNITTLLPQPWIKSLDTCSKIAFVMGCKGNYPDVKDFKLIINYNSTTLK